MNKLDSTASDSAAFDKNQYEESLIVNARAIHQQYMEDISVIHLQKAGLKTGMTVCDVGCGSGEMTQYLAKQVGPSGLIYAIDVSADQLALTKERMEHSGLKNVCYIERDIQKKDAFIDITADIVYSRVILMQLNRPQDALLNMHDMLKKGGVLSLQEVDWSTGYCSIPCLPLIQYRDAVIDLGISKNVDYNFGGKMLKVCSDLAFKIRECYTLSLKENITLGKKLITHRTDLFKEIINAGIATKEQSEYWYKSILSLPEDDSNAYFNLTDMTFILIEK